MKHEVIILNGGLKCDCGETFADMEAFTEHHLVSYNSPQEHHIRARRAGSCSAGMVKIKVCSETTESVECTRVACLNQGNGRDCFSIIGTMNGEPVGFHELRQHEALLLRHHGGYVTQHKAYKLC